MLFRSALSNVESKLKEDSKEAIESSLKELENASMELGKIMYQQAQAEAAAAGATGGDSGQESHTEPKDSSPADDVIDAEYEVKEGD